MAVRRICQQRVSVELRASVKMQFLVSETIHYVVEAGDGAAAISERKQGKGEAKPENNSYRASVWGDDRPVPRDQWPIWAKVVAKKSTPEDKGVGDVIARTIGPEASGAFKAFYEWTFGKPCGCTGRQKLWNIKYPLNSKAT